MEVLASLITTPLEYTFMQYALLEVVLIAILTGIVGSFMVLRNLAFISEALSHAIFPGVVISFILQINLAIGAIAAALLTAVGIGVTTREKKISETTATGILFSSAFALGIILISTTDNYHTSLANFLVGDILGVNSSDILLTLAAMLFILGFIALFYKQLLLTIFDPIFARAMKIRVNLIEFALLLLISLTIVVSLPAVGNILVVAMLIIPASAAKLTAKHVPQMLLLAVIYSLIAGILGIYISYYLNIATGATIVLVNALIFVAVFISRKLR